jgi:uncharacterized protein (TIGR02001 family)
MRDLIRASLVLLALFLTATEAAAQLSGNFALLSDYRYRGVSLSDRRPAIQAGIAYDHSSGLYGGAQASTVHIEGADSSLSGEGYLGFAYALSRSVSLDLGAARYFYPYSETHGSYDYNDAYAGVSVDNVHARLHYSDKYYGRDVEAWYAEISGSLQLMDTLALVAHVGYLTRYGQRSYPGAPPTSQWDGKLGLVTEVVGLTWELSVVGTDVPEDRCGNTRACATGVVLSVSRSF